MCTPNAVAGRNIPTRTAAILAIIYDVDQPVVSAIRTAHHRRNCAIATDRLVIEELVGQSCNQMVRRARNQLERRATVFRRNKTRRPNLADLVAATAIIRTAAISTVLRAVLSQRCKLSLKLVMDEACCGTVGEDSN
jgi:hypothetical protein